MIASNLSRTNPPVRDYDQAPSRLYEARYPDARDQPHSVFAQQIFVPIHRPSSPNLQRSSHTLDERIAKPIVILDEMGPARMCSVDDALVTPIANDKFVEKLAERDTAVSRPLQELAVNLEARSLSRVCREQPLHGVVLKLWAFETVA